MLATVAAAACAGITSQSGSNGIDADGATLTCADRTAGMASRLQTVMNRADRSCTTDADCSVAGADNGCYHSCSTLAVGVAGAAEIGAELAAMDQESCDEFASAGCTSPIPRCVTPGNTTCFQGSCRFAAELPLDPCPTTYPLTAASCRNVGQMCRVETTCCRCSDAGDCGVEWYCKDPGTPQPNCPVTAPARGTACSFGGDCDYCDGEHLLLLECAVGTWVEREPSKCIQ